MSYHDKQGQPLPYTCDHILHFAALGPDRTEIEVITLASRLIDGLSFSWLRRMPRNRDVAPSAADQQQVLAQLVKLGEG